MIITKAYLNKIQRMFPIETISSAFEFELGYRPATKGWMKKLVGKELTPHSVYILDSYKKITNAEKARKKKLENLEKIRQYKIDHGIPVTNELTQNQCVKAIFSHDKKKKRKVTKKTKRKARKDEAFYDSREWRELRYEALKKYGRKCLCCGESPPNVVLHVDHVKPISLYPDLKLDINNLQILCKDCNLGKSNRDEIDYR